MYGADGHLLGAVASSVEKGNSTASWKSDGLLATDP